MKRKKQQYGDFTTGPIAAPLIRFSLPVLAALFLQAMYGAVDLLIVGQFTTSADVSAVATGSQIMMLITGLVASFAMGTTILLGQKIGAGRVKEGGQVIGASIFEFIVLGGIVTLLLILFAAPVSTVMNAPEEAYTRTVSYVRICGAGTLVITAYNLLGSVFRGIGDSRTPLITVAIATGVNILGDLLLVAVFRMGTAGAALATVFAQLISVLISLQIIRRRQLPFEFHWRDVRPDLPVIRRITRLGFPIALQDFLVGISFLVIMAIVNSLGLIASAGVGCAERVCAFIMLVPSAFMQSMSAFVAQNAGAGKMARARKALYIGMMSALCIGVFMALGSFFYGVPLARIFTRDPEVAAAAAQYLKAYSIDCMLTPVFFCYIGFFNGLGETTFVMAQGIIGAFCARIPFSYLMSRRVPVSLFHVGLATPVASTLQIVLCLSFMLYLKRQGRLRDRIPE